MQLPKIGQKFSYSKTTPDPTKAGWETTESAWFQVVEVDASTGRIDLTALDLEQANRVLAEESVNKLGARVTHPAFFWNEKLGRFQVNVEWDAWKRMYPGGR